MSGPYTASQRAFRECVTCGGDCCVPGGRVYYACAECRGIVCSVCVLLVSTTLRGQPPYCRGWPFCCEDHRDLYLTREAIETG